MITFILILLIVYGIYVVGVLMYYWRKGKQEGS